MGFLASVLFCTCVAIVLAESSDAKEKGDTFSGGLQGLEIAPKVLTNVAYGNSRLSVWSHLDNPNRTPDKKQYFVMPVVMLVPETAICLPNVFSGATSLQFKVVMWDDDVASAVLTHLRQATSNPTMTSLQITTLPMEQLRLTWANSAQHLLGKFRLNNDWRSYANQDNILAFDIVVNPPELCQTAVKQLKERPDSLGSLELQYVLHGIRTSRKQITVSGQHLLQGSLYAKLSNSVDPKTGNVYLNSDDLNKLAQDAVSNVVASSTTDADYVDAGDSISLSKLVYDGLSTFKQTTDKMTPEMWRSTFWQDQFARPDKLNSYLNKVITKDQGKNHSVQVNDKEVNSEVGGSVNVKVFGLFGGGGSANKKDMTKTHVSEDELKEWLLENHYDLEWTGEVFQVKSMELYRLNTQQLAQKQNIAATYVQVHQTQYTYNVQVSFPGEAGGVEGNGSQSTAAINKRLDALDKAVRTEAEGRTAAVQKEAASRTAAVQKEAADRTAAVQQAVQKDAADRAAAVAAVNNALSAAIGVNTAALAPFKALKGQPLCVVAGPKSANSLSCPAGHVFAFCQCFHGGKYSHYTHINGNTCSCPLPVLVLMHGVCCRLMP